MKYFIVLFFAFISVSNCYAFQTIDIVSPNTKIAKQSKNDILALEDISKIEKAIFKKTFLSDSIAKRLARLEKEIYGMEQNGTTEERIDKLIDVYGYYEGSYNANKLREKAEPTYYSYSTPQKDYYTQIKPQKQSKWQKFLNDVMESFTYGTTTGYTPPIYNTYSSYPHYSVNNYMRKPYRTNNYYNPYINNYSGYYNPPMPPPQPPMNNNYRFNSYPMKNFYTGMGVKIID